ncbi:MAG TPA: UDP-N-acetylmuramoyl-L-alanyl-D-glutamate--2,6-diaminopimelate ligase [Actinobacteria bacterium]|nr:UDP-N-acetylmuramoyl-L-alanyl-D-glutamate--2,6-diaminopimelate ligase [Actinomycetota bacterium]
MLLEFDKFVSLLDPKRLEGELNVDIEDIIYDSRKAKPGSLFVCIKGFKTDGHMYIKDAIKSGVSAIVTERWLEDFGSIAQCQVEDSRNALAILSKFLFKDPTSKIQLVGITGTNGKTTTSYLVDSIFRNAGRKTGLIGTVEHKVGDRVFPVERTTPESYDLQKIFKKMVESGVTHAVMEASSHAIDLHRVDGCSFNVLVFTNLSQDHLDYHKSMRKYFLTKKKIFDDYKKTAKVINIDDSYGKEIASNSANVISYGLSKTAMVRAEEIQLHKKGSKFKILTSTSDIDLSINLKGLFNVYNSLAAAGVGLALGFSNEDIKSGIEAVLNISGRFETVDCGQDFSVFVDYAHTPDGLEKLIKAAREITEGRVITVFGCGGDRDKKKRSLMGKIAGELSDYLIITSDNPRSEEPLAIIEEIERGLGKAPFVKYKRIIDRKEAIYYALSLAESGDSVLVAGKGHESGQVFKDKVVPFDDRAVVREALLEMDLC